MNKRIALPSILVLLFVLVTITVSAGIEEATGTAQAEGGAEPGQTGETPAPSNQQLIMPHVISPKDSKGPEAPTDCPSYSYGGVVLLEHANCEGTGLAFTGNTALVNLTDYGWNDRASSVYVPSGWSLLVYEHVDGGGASRCLSWTMWDFSVDYFDNSSVNMNDAISSAQAFTNGNCGGVDLRQNGPISIAGDLVEGGEVRLTIPVKNFGSASSPAIHVYTEGYTGAGALWRADGAQPTAVVLGPGQSVEITVRHDLWEGHVGWWDTSGGVHIWNDDTGSYYGPLDAGEHEHNVEFYVTSDGQILTACDDISGGICLSYVDRQVYIAQVNLNDPAIVFELAYDLKDAANGIFEPKDVKRHVAENSRAYSFPHVAINGTAKHPDFEEAVTSSGSVLGIDGDVYGLECSTENNPTPTCQSVFTYPATEDRHIHRMGDGLDIPTGDDNRIIDLIEETDPGFVIGYRGAVLDTLTDNPAPRLSDFPEYVATEADHIDRDERTFLGISADGTKVYMAAVFTDMPTADMAQILMTMGAARVIILDSSWSTQFASLTSDGEEIGQEAKEAFFISRPAINAVVAYNRTSPTYTAFTVPVSGGIFRVATNTTLVFEPNTFADEVLLTYQPYSPADFEHPGSVGRYYQLSATFADGSPAYPDRPYEIITEYDERLLPPNTDELDLALYSWTGTIWEGEETSLVDPMNNTITASPSHFSDWVILGNTNGIYVPMIVK